MTHNIYCLQADYVELLHLLSKDRTRVVHVHQEYYRIFFFTLKKIRR